MKLDAAQSVPTTPLRMLHVTAAVFKTVQLPQGWYKMSVTNYYGYHTNVVIMPRTAPSPNANPYGTSTFDYVTQGRTASTDAPLKFYVNDSGVQWRIETYGQYAVVVYIERIPAPTESRVQL